MKPVISCSKCNTVMDTQDGFCFNCSKCGYSLDFRKKFVLFDHQYTTKGDYQLFSKEQHDLLRDEIISTILQHNGTMVFVKPHPRQNIQVLSGHLKKYDPNRVMIRNDPSMMLADYCIPVCLGASSVCLDCLALDKVAFEYLRDEESTYYYDYQKLKLVYVVHNPGELVEGVRKLYGFNLETRI